MDEDLLADKTKAVFSIYGSQESVISEIDQIQKFRTQREE
jgi:hypothetical protein